MRYERKQSAVEVPVGQLPHDRSVAVHRSHHPKVLACLWSDGCDAERRVGFLLVSFGNLQQREMHERRQSRCASDWLGSHQRRSLLASEELLGNQLGNERILYDQTRLAYVRLPWSGVFDRCASSSEDRKVVWLLDSSDRHEAHRYHLESHVRRSRKLFLFL